MCGNESLGGGLRSLNAFFLFLNLNFFFRIIVLGGDPMVLTLTLCHSIRGPDLVVVRGLSVVSYCTLTLPDGQIVFFNVLLPKVVNLVF